MRSSPDASRAFRRGWGRVFRAPALVAGAWAVTWLVALPAAMAVRQAVRDHLGSSLASTRVAEGVDVEWWEEFRAQARGAASTLTPSVIGAAAPLSNWSSFVDGPRPPGPLVATVGAGVLAWIFLTGGLVDRLARARPVGARAFFGACGVFFFRFLRLGILAGAVYLLLALPWHTVLFDRLYPWLTRNTSAERVAFAWRVALYLVWLLPLLAVNLVVDYAKVRAVVEDRRSMIGALAAGARFAWRHPGSVIGLYVANTLVLAVGFAVYVLVAPGVRGGTSGMLLALAAGQAWILARVATKLAFLSTSAALLQDGLSHAAYAAPPVPIWPESPAAEAIDNAARYGIRPPA